MTDIKRTDRPLYRMAEHGDAVDHNGIVTSSDGTRWGDYEALRRLADELDAEAAERATPFIRVEPDQPCSEPTPSGGVLDAIAPSIWKRRNTKGGES